MAGTVNYHCIKQRHKQILHLEHNRQTHARLHVNLSTHVDDNFSAFARKSLGAAEFPALFFLSQSNKTEPWIGKDQLGKNTSRELEGEFFFLGGILLVTCGFLGVQGEVFETRNLLKVEGPTGGLNFFTDLQASILDRFFQASNQQKLGIQNGLNWALKRAGKYPPGNFLHICFSSQL